MVMCEQVVILSISKPGSIRIIIDLPEPVPMDYLVEYLQIAYCDLLPKSGFVPKAHIELHCETCLLELTDRVWLLPKPQQEN